MDKFSDKLAEYAEQFKSVVVEHAPEAYDALLRIVQIDAAQELLFGFGLLGGGLYVYTLGYSLWDWSEEGISGLETVDLEIGATIAHIIGIGIVLSSFPFLFDVWNWVAFIDPDLALANKILESSGLKP